MPGLPSFPFYPGDWMKDPALRQCTIATRGVWIDLICFIHEHGDEGRIESTPMRLSRYCGCMPGEMVLCLKELRDLEVCTVEMDNDRDQNSRVVIYSKRMHRDETKREQNRERQRRFREKSQDDDETALHNAGSNGDITRMSEDEYEKEEEVLEMGGVGGRDPTLVHPAIVAFNRRFPEQRLILNQREKIIRAVHDDPERVAVWEGVTLERWETNTYSEANIYGMINAFGSDWKQHQKQAKSNDGDTAQIHRLNSRERAGQLSAEQVATTSAKAVALVNQLKGG